MESEETTARHSHVPRFAKAIILAQAAVILVFTVAMYQDYVNSVYLQQYVITLLTSNIIADAALSMITASVFALGTFTLLGSMGTAKETNRELKLLSETPDESFDMPTMPILETVASTGTRTRNPRRRKPRANNEDIYRSMKRHREENSD